MAAPTSGLVTASIDVNSNLVLTNVDGTTITIPMVSAISAVQTVGGTAAAPTVLTGRAHVVMAGGAGQYVQFTRSGQLVMNRSGLPVSLVPPLGCKIESGLLNIPYQILSGANVTPINTDLNPTQFWAGS